MSLLLTWLMRTFGFMSIGVSKLDQLTARHADFDPIRRRLGDGSNEVDNFLFLVVKLVKSVDENGQSNAVASFTKQRLE